MLLQREYKENTKQISVAMPRISKHLGKNYLAQATKHRERTVSQRGHTNEK